MEGLLVALEIEQDRKELEELGLSPIEIEGYFECFAENYFPELRSENAVRVQMSKVWPRAGKDC